MNRSIIMACLLGLMTAGITTTPVQLRAQDTGKPAAERKAPGKRPRVIPFHGKLKAVDPSAKTISVYDLTIQITPETKIDKAGNPATLPDGVVGEVVSGGYRKSSDGKLVATTIHFGPKQSKSHSKKKAGGKKSE